MNQLLLLRSALSDQKGCVIQASTTLSLKQLSLVQRKFDHLYTDAEQQMFFSEPSGNHTSGSRFYSDLRLHPPAHSQASFKALGCSCNCRRLVCGSFQLTHMSQDDHAVQLIEPWQPKRRQTLLQLSQRCHKGEFRDVSISARQQSLQCGQNLRGHFLRATLPMTVGSCARAMAVNGKTKGLIIPPPR